MLEKPPHSEGKGTEVIISRGWKQNKTELNAGGEGEAREFCLSPGSFTPKSMMETVDL